MSHSPSISTAPSRTPQVYPHIVVLILGMTIVEKVALPITGNWLPISTLIAPAAVMLAWVRGAVLLDRRSFGLWFAFMLCSCLSFIVNSTSPQVSLGSVLLVGLLQLCLAFRLRDGASDARRGLYFFVELMFYLAIAGVVQFASQRVVGSRIAFPMDSLPSVIAINGYNNLNPLSYGSEIFKSNGIVFAEPSYFSQFLALATIVELITRQRVSRLIVFAAGMLCSYSGTGLIVLALFGSILLIRSGNLMLLVACLSILAIIIVFGSALQVDAITNRFSEFTTPNTSGHARFVSAFYLIGRYSFEDYATLLIGEGPGTIRSYFDVMPFTMFGPTWAKLFFEYGLIGTVVYVVYLASCMRMANASLMWPMLATYTFMGGYLADATLVTAMIVLVIWGSAALAKQPEAEALVETG